MVVLVAGSSSGGSVDGGCGCSSHGSVDCCWGCRVLVSGDVSTASVKSLVVDGMFVVTGRGGTPEEKEQQLD